MIDTALDTKNELLELLDVDDEKLLENIPIVLKTLSLTIGLWKELHYAYKGAEIAQRCRQETLRMMEVCQHWKRLERVNLINDEAIRVELLFHKAQSEYMYPS